MEKLSDAGLVVGAPTEIGSLWQEAVDVYRNIVGGQHVIANNQAANVGTILASIDDMEKTFDHRRNDGSKMARFRSLVRDSLGPIEALSEVAAHASRAVFPPSEAIFSAMKYLIRTANTVSGDYNKLTEFFQDVKFFLDGIQLWETHVPAIPELKRAIMATFASVLVLCGLYTRYIKRKRLVKAFKALVSGEDSELKEAHENFKKMVQRGRDIVQNAVLSTVHQTKLETQAVHAHAQDSSKSMRRMEQNLQTAVKGTERANRFLSDQERETILVWFSSLDFEVRQREIFAKYHPGTCKWLLGSVEFQEWVYSTQTSTLWCPAGTGKTTIMSAAICYIQDNIASTDAAMAFVYCNYKEKKTHIVSEIWSSVIRQLAERCNVLPPEVESYRNKFINMRAYPKEEDHVLLLKTISRLFGKIYIFIDALDECPEQNREDFLLSAKRVESFLRLFITSRHSVELEGKLSRMTRIDIAADPDDIRIYLESKLSTETRLARLLTRNPQAKQEVIERLLAQANGMFLLVHLQMNYLSTRQRLQDVRRALNTLPKDFYEYYDDTMQRIQKAPEDDRELAMQVLSFVFYARRPLLLDELLHALSVDSGATDLDVEDLHDKVIVFSVSSGLVRVDENTRHVRLAHLTVHEYLQQVCESLLAPYETKFALACLTYLSFESFAQGYCTRKSAMLERLEKYCFLEYACHYWASHTSNHMSEEIMQLAMALLLNKNKLATCVQVLHFPRHRTGNWHDKFPRSFTNLHAVAHWGVASILEKLSLSDAIINGRDSFDRTPLHLSSTYGHINVTQRLLDLGAEVDISDKTGQTALALAARNGHIATVELLLAHGSADSIEDKEGWTPLHWAIMGSHNDIVKSLLRRATHMDPDRTHHNKALALAAEAGASTTIQMLLDEGANIDDRDHLGSTPLHWAVPEGHEEASRVLLENGASPNSRDIYGNTPIHWAISHSGIARLLSEHHANIDETNMDGQSALLWGVLAGQADVVATLVELGANINISNSYGFTPLHAAALKGYESIAQILLMNGADPNICDQDGWTPLHAAMLTGENLTIMLLIDQTVDGHRIARRVAEWLKNDDKRALMEEMADRKSIGSSVVRGLSSAVNYRHTQRLLALLENGADIDAKDEIGERTALGTATRLGREDAVRLLIDHGAYIDIRELNGHTPLHWAASWGYSQLVEILIEEGGATIDLEVFGWTAILMASREWNPSIVEYLVKRGADLNARDFHGRTALHWSCIHGDKQLAENLLKAGAPIDDQDHNGNSALHWAIACEHTAVVTTLLMGGANVQLQAKDGSTALHLAAYAGNINTVEQLFNDQKQRKRRGRRQTCENISDISDGSVDMTIRDVDGLSALDMAILTGNSQVEQFLKREGDSHVDQEGRTDLSPAEGLVDEHQRQFLTSHPPPLNVSKARRNDYLGEEEFDHGLGRAIISREARQWLQEQLKARGVTWVEPVNEVSQSASADAQSSCETRPSHQVSMVRETPREIPIRSRDSPSG